MALYEGKVQEQKGFQWRDGDEVIVCVEGAEVKTGSAAPYSNPQLRVVIGPLNDSKRDAGPYVRDDNTIGSRMLYDNASFSDKTKRRINAILFGVGHEGDVRIETDEDWLRAVLDREVKIRIKMEEYQGKDRPRPAAYVRPTLDEMRKVAAVYEEFGCARGYGWTEQPDTSLNPWDPAKYLGPQVQAGPGAQSRRNLQRPTPARDPAETRAIEADVARFYPGRRLADVYTGVMSPRELAVLIEWLPDIGALSASLRAAAATRPTRGGSVPLPVGHPLLQFGWGRDRHMAADIVEALLGVQYVVSSAAPRKKGSPRPRKPKPYPRPGVVVPGSPPSGPAPNPAHLR
jgi:hypothetical protein